VWLKYLAEGCAFCYILLTLSCSPRHLLLGIVLTCIITTDMHLNRVVGQWRRKHNGMRDIEGIGACDFFSSVYSIRYFQYEVFRKGREL